MGGVRLGWLRVKNLWHIGVLVHAGAITPPQDRSFSTGIIARGRDLATGGKSRETSYRTYILIVCPVVRPLGGSLEGQESRSALRISQRTVRLRQFSRTSGLFFPEHSNIYDVSVSLIEILLNATLRRVQT